MLYYFLLGIIFIQWCIPLGDSLIELITTFLELLKGKIGLRLMKYNAEISKMTEAKKQSDKQMIGFKIDSEEDYEEDDEEEYE